MTISKEDLDQLSLSELKDYYNHLHARKKEKSQILKLYAKRGMEGTSQFKKTKEEL